LFPKWSCNSRRAKLRVCACACACAVRVCRDKKNETMRAQVPYLLPSVSPPQTPAGTCECQVVRSLSDWSGCNRTEDSIAQVHISCWYIYIRD
jgi:hypothetical protein